MENKFSPKIKNEIEEILKEISFWNEFFSIKFDFFFDGWAIFLKEKSLYPRNIVIFKSYTKNSYSVKSFEIHLNYSKKEEYKEIFSVKNIGNQKLLFKELKEIIYGKDILNNASKIYKNKFLK
ncbi:MAG: hypothetical protein ACFE8L_05340 [Candidatus Hodarchaeota archaeon]